MPPARPGPRRLFRLAKAESRRFNAAPGGVAAKRSSCGIHGAKAFSSFATRRERMFGANASPLLRSTHLVPNTFFPASGEPDLGEGLRGRYHHLLDRLQEVRTAVGTDRMPSILPGDLRDERLARGDADDSVSALRESVHFLKGELWKTEDKVASLVSEIGKIRRELLDEVRRLERRVCSLEKSKGQGIMAWFTNQ